MIVPIRRGLRYEAPAPDFFNPPEVPRSQPRSATKRRQKALSRDEPRKRQMVRFGVCHIYIYKYIYILYIYSKFWSIWNYSPAFHWPCHPISILGMGSVISWPLLWRHRSAPVAAHLGIPQRILPGSSREKVEINMSINNTEHFSMDWLCWGKSKPETADFPIK